MDPGVAERPAIPHAAEQHQQIARRIVGEPESAARRRSDPVLDLSPDPAVVLPEIVHGASIGEANPSEQQHPSPDAVIDHAVVASRLRSDLRSDSIPSPAAQLPGGVVARGAPEQYERLTPPIIGRRRSRARARTRLPVETGPCRIRQRLRRAERRVARIAETVPIPIVLRGIGDMRAIVERQQHLIPIGVEKVGREKRDQRAAIRNFRRPGLLRRPDVAGEIG